MLNSAPSLRRAFRHLKRGVFPPEAIGQFTFGRESEFRFIQTRLRDVENGGSRHVFVEGTYGQGKSHVLSAIESISLEAGFAVSWVTIDGYSHAFNHPARYLHSLLENLRVPRASRRGLASVITQWLQGPERALITEWASRTESSLSWQVVALAHSLDRGLNPPWDVGYTMESRDIAHMSGKRAFAVVSTRMQDAASLVCAAGLKGLVYLFDEVEAVATLLWGIRQRFLSYEFLNLLVDARRHPRCFFGFAVTPDFTWRLSLDRLKSDDYAREYRGGCSFVEKWHGGALDVLRLKKLSRSNLVELCVFLRDTHRRAFPEADHKHLTAKFIEMFVDDAQQANRGIRDIIRSLVHLLEISEQHPGVDIAAAYQEARAS